MKIYLVRHGQKGLGKDYDILNKIGKEQARRIGPYFKDKKINTIYCSENERAVQTLEYIKPSLNKKSRIIITPEVRQHNVPEEVGKDAIKQFDLKVESEAELKQRIKKFLDKLKKKHKRDNVLIISHKEVIKSLICHILNLPLKESIYINKLPTGSISSFNVPQNGKVKDFMIGDLTYLMRGLK